MYIKTSGLFFYHGPATEQT